MTNRRTPIFIALVLLLQVCAAGWYLHELRQETDLGVSLDDAWIHFCFAENLARHGELSFNTGQPSSGSTSFFWVVLLAGGLLAGFSPVHWAILLGLAATLLGGPLLFLLVRDSLEGQPGADLTALLAGLLYALSGNILWHGLSGMETALFVTLGLAAILAHTRGRTILAAVLAGLLVLTRIEGVLLPLLMLLALALRPPNAPREPSTGGPAGRRLKPLLLTALIPLMLAAPMLAHNRLTSGSLLPTTFTGRRWICGLPRSIFDMEWGRSFSFLRDAVPQLTGRLFSGSPLRLGILLLAAAGLIVWLRSWRRTIAGDETGGRGVTGVQLLVVWALGHTLVYALFLTVAGHGGRYIAVAAVTLLALISLAVRAVQQLARSQSASPWPGRLAAGGLAALLLLLAAGQLRFFCQVETGSVWHINRVHVVTGQWLRQHLPPTAVVAAFDIGAVKYFFGGPVVDLGGLIDRDYFSYLYANRVVDYLRARGVEYLVLPESFSEEGVGYQLGLYPRLGEEIVLLPLVSHSIPPEQHTRHWQATLNALPRLVVYRVSWDDWDSQKDAVADAVKDFKKTTGARWSVERILRHSGNLLAAWGFPEKAADRYRWAIDVDPLYVDAWVDLGVAALKLGRKDEAAAIFTRVLEEMDPDHARARQGLEQARPGSLPVGSAR
jgi:hypothetical protein